MYKIIIHRKFGSDTEKSGLKQRKHKYKQDTVQNTTIFKSITVVDTWYWSINI